MKRIFPLLSVLLVTLVAGCQQAKSPAPIDKEVSNSTKLGRVPDFYRFPLDHTGYYPDEAISPTPRIVKKYGLVNVGIHSASKSSPTVVDGVIYVGADSGHLYAIDEATMQVRWSFRVRPSATYGIHATPAVDEKRVYISAYDGYLYALDRQTGRLEWQVKIGDHIGSSPVLWKEVLYVAVELGDSDGRLSCVARATGQEVFHSAKFGAHAHGTPTVNTKTKTVFVGANNYMFFALDATSGRQKWAFRTEGQIKSTAALFEDSVLFSSWDTYFYRLKQDSGELVWKHKAVSRSMVSPAVDPESRLVYFASHDHKIYALNFDTGKKVWGALTSGIVQSSPVIVKNAKSDGKILVIGAHDLNLWGVDAALGRRIFGVDVGGPITSVPTIRNGTIYVSGDDGFLYVMK